jgi:DEAD/DEAH box helicase domain-containing protein
VREIQNLLWRWRCPTCGESGSERTKEAEFCASCGAAGLSWQQYLQPAGFAADLRKDPHADPDEVSYIAPQTPAVSARGAVWMPLPDPINGRRRATRSGSVFFSNAGQGRGGYTICLSCGRPHEPSVATDESDPDAATAWVHKPLLGKPDSGGDCPGARQPFSVKHHLLLGHEITTDVFELQAANIGSRGAYLALAIALREALARRISIEPEAMGVAVAPRGGLGGPVFSAFLFDQAVGGAGFSIQADPLLLEILPEATEILDCKVPGCRTGCPACVLTGDLSEDDADGLDRLAALEGARRLAANAAPRPEDRAHPTAHLVADALDIINRDSADATRIVFRLAAPLDPAGLTSWRAAEWVRRSPRVVVLSVPPGSVATLDGAARLALRDKLSQWGATIEETVDADLPNAARVIAEVIRPGTTCVLATRDPNAFIGDAGWARPSTAPIVRFEQSGTTLTGTPIPIGSLVPAQGALLRDIGAECDGSLRGFGSRMAKLIWDALAEAGGPVELRITALAYSDRYFSSPLVARLALDTFAHLAKPQSANPPPLRLRIAALRWSDFAPSRVEHDWKHEDDRTSVIGRYAARLGLNLGLTDPRNIPHSRILTLTYSNGTQTDIYFDQGFGTWRPARRTEFRFNLHPIAQLDELAQIDASLVSSGKTYVVVQIRAGDR